MATILKSIVLGGVTPGCKVPVMLQACQRRNHHHMAERSHAEHPPPWCIIERLNKLASDSDSLLGIYKVLYYLGLDSYRMHLKHPN